jgi:acyl-CoA synthetase (AMP-forming)/AMP-acid ligase II
MTTPYAPLAPDMVTLLSTRAAEAPEAVACDFLDGRGRTTRSLTYGALDRRACQIAAQLLRNANPGDRVLLVYPPGLDFVAAFFGCLYAGLVAVPLPVPRSSASAEAERMLAAAIDCQCAGILGPDDVRARMAERPEMQALVRERWLTLSDDQPEDAVRQSPRPADIAFLQYTSGSTDSPKGVAVRHGNLVHNIARIVARCGADHTWRALTWLPHFHDLGLIGGILAPIYAGVPTSLMAPSSFVKRPLGWLRTMSAGRYAITGGPNFAYELCVEQYDPQALEGVDLSHWQCAFNGAERVSAETIGRFIERFGPYGFRAETMYPCYGLAEATLMVASSNGPRPPLVRAVDADALDRDGLLRDPSSGSRARTLVSCGQAAADQVIAIVDPSSGDELEDGRGGEIWTSDDSVAAGYFAKPTESAAVFAAHLKTRPDLAFLRTGDLGVRERGEIFVVGRLKDLIIIDGRNLHPADIEATVAAAAGLSVTRACVAFGMELESHLEGLAILVETDDPDRLDLAAIKRAVAERHEVQLSRIVSVTAGAIPRTTSGKVRRAAARDAYLRGALVSIAPG